MSIQDIWKKINFDRPWSQWFWVGTIYGMVFLGIGAVGAAFSEKAVGEVVVSSFETPAYTENSKKDVVSGSTETVYASKTGKKYYYEHCSGLKRVKTENRISFASASLAKNAGYTQATNCESK